MKPKKPLTDEQRQRAYAKTREWYARNRERQNEYCRQYYRKHRERLVAESCERGRARRKDPQGRLKIKANKYGISPETLQALIDSHPVCRICQSPPPLVVDHCHTTGKVRGMLCNGCNIGLGGFRDNPTFMTAAIKYLTDRTHA